MKEEIKKLLEELIDLAIKYGESSDTRKWDKAPGIEEAVVYVEAFAERVEGQRRKDFKAGIEFGVDQRWDHESNPVHDPDKAFAAYLEQENQ